MKLWESLRRPDWLKELQAVLVVGLIGLSGLGGFGVVRTLTDGSLRVVVPVSGVSATVDGQLREGVVVAQDQGLTLTVAEPSLAQRAAWALTTLPTYLVLIALLVLLLRIVWHARRGDPFTMATVRRLRVLAVLALAGGWLAFLVELFAAMHLSSTVLANQIRAELAPPLYWFLIGFGLFAIAEVVKRGWVMRSELETVI